MTPSSSTNSTFSSKLFVDEIDVATTTVTTSAANYAATVREPREAPEPDDEGDYPCYYDTDFIQENSSSALVDGSSTVRGIATADFMWNFGVMQLLDFISFLQRWGFVPVGFLAGLFGAHCLVLLQEMSSCRSVPRWVLLPMPPGARTQSKVRSLFRWTVERSD